MWKVRTANALAIASIGWVLVIAILIHRFGDRWWVGTLALFGPRAALALPILIAVVAWPWSSKVLKIATPLALVVAGWAIMGLCVPIRIGSPIGDTYRVLTCNVAQGNINQERLLRLIVDDDADFVLLQEVMDESKISLPKTWHSLRAGRMVIASRFPLRERLTVTRDLPERWPRPVGVIAEGAAQERTIQIGAVYLHSPRLGLTKMLDGRTGLAPSRRQTLVEETAKRAAESRHVAESFAEIEGSLIVAGDFNTPAESWLFDEYWGDFENGFSRAGWGIGNTCFLERRGLTFGARIDHVLTRGNWRVSRCWVGPDVGSDHRPVLADVVWEE